MYVGKRYKGWGEGMVTMVTLKMKCLLITSDGESRIVLIFNADKRPLKNKNKNNIFQGLRDLA